jgi:hypothetical protein
MSHYVSKSMQPIFNLFYCTHCWPEDPFEKLRVKKATRVNEFFPLILVTKGLKLTFSN